MESTNPHGTIREDYIDEDNIDYQEETFNLRPDHDKPTRRIRFDGTSLFSDYDIVKDIRSHYASPTFGQLLRDPVHWIKVKNWLEYLDKKK